MRSDSHRREGKRHPRMPMAALMAAIAAFSWGGCLASRPDATGSGSPADGPSGPIPIRPVGVVRVLDPATGGVVIDFGVNRPPRRGAEVLFRRDGRVVGTGRIADPVDPPFAAAEVVSGDPRAGDLAE